MSTNPNETADPKADKVDLRLPKGLRAVVQAQADRDDRSMNAQIVHYVKAGLEGIDNMTLAQAVLEIRTSLAAIEERLNQEK